MFASEMTEKITHIVNIDDIEPEIFKIMLEYIYGGKVKYDTLCDTVVAKLSEAADKYQLWELKNNCFNRLVKTMSRETCGKLCVLAYLHCAEFHTREAIFRYCSK